MNEHGAWDTTKDTPGDIETIKQLLDAKSVKIGGVNERIIHAAIQAVISGDTTKAENMLKRKVEIDSAEGNQNPYKLSQEIANQVIGITEEYLKEKKTQAPHIPTPVEEPTIPEVTEAAIPEIVEIQPETEIESTSEAKLIIESDSDSKITYNKSINTPTKIKNTSSMSPGKQNTLPPREKLIQNIGSFLKNEDRTIDTVVVHGDTIEGKPRMELDGDNELVEQEGKMAIKSSPDFDTRAALYLLNDESLGDVGYRQTMIVGKGEKVAAKKGENVLHIDVGGKTLSMKKNAKGGNEIFIDHHQEGCKDIKTSATELMYEILTKNNIIKKEPWLDNMVRFTTNVDNLSYVYDNRYTENNFLEKNWSKSLFGLYKDVPFENIVQWFKEGRDPFKPNFTDEEKESIIIHRYRQANDTKHGGKQTIEEDVTLGKIIEEKENEISIELGRNLPFAEVKMKENGIAFETPELGRVLYNTMDKQADRNGKMTINSLKHGYLIAKATGYDTYVSYNELTKKFFINAGTHDLSGIYEKLKKIVPGTKLVRGVMIVPPAGKHNRENITREKFLDILGLKKEESPKAKTSEPAPQEPDKISNPEPTQEKNPYEKYLLYKKITEEYQQKVADIKARAQEKRAPLQEQKTKLEQQLQSTT